MTILRKLIVLVRPLLLLTLTTIAGYAFFRAWHLSLPISQALGFFTVVLPLICGVSIQQTYDLVQRSSQEENYKLSLRIIAVIGFQLIYETIIVTLAMTYILPPSAVSYGLTQRWQSLYTQKNGKAVKAIQDTFDCCGVNSVLDRAFPFNDNDRAQCSRMYGRNKSCLGEWMKAEQTNAGLILLVASVVFLIQVVSIIAFVTRPLWAGSNRANSFRGHTNGDIEQPEEDNRADTRRPIENGTVEEYHDELEASEVTRPIEVPDSTQDQGLEDVPSSLVDAGDKWRNNRGVLDPRHPLPEMN